MIGLMINRAAGHNRGFCVRPVSRRSTFEAAFRIDRFLCP
jgi:hypothetical protein